MSTSPNPIDLQEVLKITNNKLELAKEMVAMLGAELPGLQVSINKSYAQQDYTELHNHIHKLHGSCCYCGVPNLRQQSAALEVILKKQQYQKLEAAISALNAEINRILTYMKEQNIIP